MPLILNGDGSLSGTSLQVDSPTFVVDHSNNRVGVGTSTPSHPLHVSGNISVSATNGSKIGYNVEDAFSSNSTSGAHYGMTFGVPSNNRVSISGWDGVHLWTGGASRLQVDGVGRILMPNQPAFRVGRGSNYNPGANADIVFDVVSSGSHFNNGGHYNSANGRFIAPVAGKYLFSTNIIWQSIANGTNMTDALYINKNGSLMSYGNRRAFYTDNSTGASGYFTDHTSVILDLAANDYVTVYNLRNYTVHGNANYSWFMGYLIG